MRRRKKRPHRLPTFEPHRLISVWDSLLLFGDNDPDFPHDFKPTMAPPGTDEKIEVLRLRAERREPLHHPDDAKTYDHWDKPLPRRMLNEKVSLPDPSLQSPPEADEEFSDVFSDTDTPEFNAFID